MCCFRRKGCQNTYMNRCHNATLILATMLDQQWVMLHWPSFWGWGRERVASVFAPKGGQYLIYRCLKSIASWITQDARPKIDDAPLMLIFKLGRWVCCFCFCHSRQLVPYLWMAATNRHFGYPRCKAPNHWCLVNGHFQNGAVTSPIAIFPITAANTLVTHSSKQITFQLQYLHDP